MLQGSLQCCVTGAAFQQMVQHGEPLLIEAVMSSVKVFSRMHSQQKGQVMDLLGQQGLYQHALQQDAEPRHIPVSPCSAYHYPCPALQAVAQALAPALLCPACQVAWNKLEYAPTANLLGTSLINTPVVS